MNEFTTDRLLTDLPRGDRAKKFRPLSTFLVPLAAILFQVYLPRFFPYLGYLELPLLVTPDVSPLPTLDSTRLLAHEAVAAAIENRRPTWRGGTLSVGHSS